MGINSVVPEPADTPFVALSEAMTWIAFQHALNDANLRMAVFGERVIDQRSNDERASELFAADVLPLPGYAVHGLGPFRKREQGLEKLEHAWAAIRAQVDLGNWEIRGRYTPTYSPSDAQLEEPELLTGSRLAVFSQFDVSTGGIRRQPLGQPTVMWKEHPLAYGRAWASAADDDKRISDGCLMVEVRRDDLMKTYPSREERGAPNRQLDHDEIIAKAAAMRAKQPGLSKGSAAASIVEELPPNPTTGKRRDNRHIERMIAPLWAGGL